MKKLCKTNRRLLASLYGCFWMLGRPRTADALGILVQGLPARVVRKLPPIRVFAPAPVWGEVLRLPCSGQVLLYLSSDLELLPQRCVNYVLAHEFAHIALGHYGPDFRYADTPWVAHHDEKSEEIAADSLAVAWGYSTDDNPVHIDAVSRRLEAEAEDRRIRKDVEAETHKRCPWIREELEADRREYLEQP